jgi:hypothetical protein
MIGQVSLSALENDWQRRATAAAIAGARGVIQVDGPIPPGTPNRAALGCRMGMHRRRRPVRLDRDACRAGGGGAAGYRAHLRMTALDPEPWDAGAVGAILPDLASACEHVDWSKPLTGWPRETMIEFLLTAMPLIRRAMIARDMSAQGVTRKSRAEVIVRQTNAAAGGPLLAPDELNGEIAL